VVAARGPLANLRALSFVGSGARYAPVLLGGASIQSSRLGADGSCWDSGGKEVVVVIVVGLRFLVPEGAAVGRAGPQPSSSSEEEEEEESELGPVVGLSERSAGGGAGPSTRFGAEGDGAGFVGGAGPAVPYSSPSEVRGISSSLVGFVDGGSEGPIDGFWVPGAGVMLFPAVGGSEGPMTLSRLLSDRGAAAGPKSSFESSSSNGISSSFSRREDFAGGDPTSASSSDARLRFWR
jgi:hypothetical protein